MSAVHTGIDPQTAADMRRQVNELRDRIDRAIAADPSHMEDVVRTLAHSQPDLVSEALDDAGAPE